MRVLVTGATGFVGSRLVPALQSAGHEVVALTRSPDDYAGPASSVRGGDLLDAETLDDAFEGIDAAYYLVHSMGSGADFAERDRTAARHFAEGASDAGVERVIYLGGLGEEGDDLSEHLRSRREVEAVLAEGEFELTTLRAAIIVGHGSVSFETIRQLVKRLPLMITPAWLNTGCQPIAVNDVIAYLVGVLETPAAAGETYEIGGPEVLSYGEMLKETARAMDRRVPVIVHVPVLTPRLSSYWVGLVTDVDFRVARELIEGLKNPVVADDAAIREHVAVDLTPFETAVRQAVGEAE